LATYKPTNTVIAVKSINLYDKNLRKQFKNDLRVLSDNKCFNLVRFYGAFFSEGNVKILLEYMNLGSLDKVIETINKKNLKVPFIPEIVLSQMTYQILLGLKYLHKVKHQIHRDIKPGNILINTDGIVKLTDFGIAKSLHSTKYLSHTYIGSQNFMSPERISGKEYGYPSDIWSVGLVVYELANGKNPYEKGNDILMQIVNIVDGEEPSMNPSNFSKELCDFVSKCLKKDPKERLNVEELLQHEFISKYIGQENKIPEYLALLYDYMIIDS
jgi:serine/threonine protein kinase